MADDNNNPSYGDLFVGDETVDDEEWKEKLNGSLLQIENRPRGILSDTDREYLCGLREYKHAQSESNRKQDIRERTVNALEDFLLLGLLLDEEEYDKIFNKELDEEHLHGYLEWMITFAYIGLDQDTDRLADIIEKGVFYGSNLDKTGRWVGEASNVDVSINIEYNPDVDKLYDQLQQGDGDSLTPAEIGVLVQSGKLEPEDLEALEDSGPTLPRVYAGSRGESN